MPRRRSVTVDPVGLVPTGSTLLNLACSDNTVGAFRLGTVNNIIGDSSAGKTLLGLTLLAEASLLPEFDDYLFIHDDVERRSFFRVEKLFGKKLAGRIQGPDGAVNESASTIIESFYYHLDSLIKDGKPFIYILDSMDALDSEAAEKKFQESKEAFSKEKEAKGSYGDGKAKINSANLRSVAQKLRDTKSILIVISQTRDNIGLGFSPKTRAGGRALEFYCSHVMWLAKSGKIKKTIRGKPRTIGVQVRVNLTKNSLTGRQVEVDFPLYYNYGLDDISSMINYCLSEKALEKKAGKIVWQEEVYSEASLVSFFEEHGTKELQELCKETWESIARRLVPDRRPKYE